MKCIALGFENGKLTVETKSLGLDTICWHFKKSVPMYHGDRFEITETKWHQWRLWDAKRDTQVNIYDSLTEAKDAAELAKQTLAVFV